MCSTVDKVLNEIFCFSWQKLPTKFKKFYAEFENMMVSCMKTRSPPLFWSRDLYMDRLKKYIAVVEEVLGSFT